MTDVFEFVVIGAGSSGCVVADKLSHSGRHSVLLLETRRDDRRLDIAIAAGYVDTFLNDQVNWKDVTQPERRR